MSRQHITLLQRREIEAEIAAALIDAYAEKLGRKSALRIAAAAIRKLARETGRSLAARCGTNGLRELAEAIDTIWTEENALEIEILARDASRLHFNVVRCRYAEQYRRIGLQDYGHTLSCNRDGALASGFNPNIRLRRTQTIMEGAAYCDFRFDLKG